MGKAQRAHVDSRAGIKALNKRGNVGRGHAVSMLLCIKGILNEAKSAMLGMAGISDELGESE